MNGKFHFMQRGKKLVAALLIICMLTACLPNTALRVSAQALGIMPLSVSQLDSSGFHTVAVKFNGSLWAWGANRHGQLGDGTNIDRPTPIRIGTSYNWASAVAAGTHTIATKTDGSLWEWGNNYIFFGPYDLDAIANTYIPTRIGICYDWASIAIDATLSAAIKTDGGLWAWGRTHNISAVPPQTLSETPIQMGTDTDWASVSVGASSIRAIKTDGTLWAWGANFAGQLSDGTYRFRKSYKQIGTSHTWATASGTHTLTTAIATDASLWAWSGRETTPNGIPPSVSAQIIIGYVPWQAHNILWQ